MFRIDRQYRRMITRCQILYKLSCHHKCLLIGQCNHLSCLDGIHRRPQTGISHHSRQHDVYRLCLHNLAQSIRSGIYFNRHVRQSLLQLKIFVVIGYYHGFWLELPSLFHQQVYLVVCRQCINFIQVRMLLDNLQSLCPDRTGRAQYCNLLFHITKTLCISPD